MSHTVQFTYTNHRGETDLRVARPSFIYFGTSSWHPEEQWLLEAVALDREGDPPRTFAMKDITGWQPVADQEEASE